VLQIYKKIGRNQASPEKQKRKAGHRDDDMGAVSWISSQESCLCIFHAFALGFFVKQPIDSRNSILTME
jgi:hypothetical protein